MFYYEEKKTFIPSRQYYRRSIKIFDGGLPVGEIQQNIALDGSIIPVDSWYKKEPIEVSYYDPDSDGAFKRAVTIKHCRTVAEGKKIFAEWYAEHKSIFEKAVTEKNIKYLPASVNNEFYPTPSSLAGQMSALVDWKNVQTILEPSAGKGDLADFACRCASSKVWKSHKDYKRPSEIMKRVDCIEVDENLRHILTGKGYHVVHDDFLTFNSIKHYDLIIMNPPFSNGDEHLLKAVSLQRNGGGQIVCLLNAETIKNPYTNRRRLLAGLMDEYGASVRFVSKGFARAERKTDVEAAIVYFNIPAAKNSSFILDGLKKAEEQREQLSSEPKAIVSGDWIDAMVASFDYESKIGLTLMREYNELAPYIMNGSGDYAKPIIQLEIAGHKASSAGTDEINSFLRSLRYKYWSNMMERPELTSRMTQAMRGEYSNKIDELKDYDFTRYNVKRVIAEISVQLSHGVEESILKLFDELSAKHSWYPECEKNVHYYNGWATNKAHKVNSKVILPINGFYACWDGTKKLEAYYFASKISDIERALAYLDGEGAICRIDPDSVARLAEERQRTTVEFSYFDATFYKKGTCHIKFHPDAQILLDRLNIFASRRKSWLPPSYGKKRYSDMEAEERTVIDEFEGKESYEKVMNNPEYYVISPAKSTPLLGA